jgi:hypothetical protein
LENLHFISSHDIILRRIGERCKIKKQVALELAPLELGVRLDHAEWYGTLPPDTS